jgi:hypothetical protein
MHLFQRILCASAIAIPTLGFAADMRDCRLDALTFVDPWGGDDRFVVTRVGTVRAYLCFDENGAMVDTDVPRVGADCQGPYGDLVLEGRYEGWSDELLPGMTAIWHESPAAPCCGWDVYPTSEAPADRLEKVTWFAADSAPVLGTIPTATIEVESGEPILVNPLIALVCAHSLP